jgi:hypothetical protein
MLFEDASSLIDGIGVLGGGMVDAEAKELVHREF